MKALLLATAFAAKTNTTAVEDRTLKNQIIRDKIAKEILDSGLNFETVPFRIENSNVLELIRLDPQLRTMILEDPVISKPLLLIPEQRDLLVKDWFPFLVEEVEGEGRVRYNANYPFYPATYPPQYIPSMPFAPFPVQPPLAPFAPIQLEPAVLPQVVEQPTLFRQPLIESLAPAATYIEPSIIYDEASFFRVPSSYYAEELFDYRHPDVVTTDAYRTPDVRLDIDLIRVEDIPSGIITRPVLERAILERPLLDRPLLDRAIITERPVLERPSSYIVDPGLYLPNAWDTLSLPAYPRFDNLRNSKGNPLAKPIVTDIEIPTFEVHKLDPLAHSVVERGAEVARDPTLIEWLTPIDRSRDIEAPLINRYVLPDRIITEQITHKIVNEISPEDTAARLKNLRGKIDKSTAIPEGDWQLYKLKPEAVVTKKRLSGDEDTEAETLSAQSEDEKEEAVVAEAK